MKNIIIIDLVQSNKRYSEQRYHDRSVRSCCMVSFAERNSR